MGHLDTCYRRDYHGPRETTRTRTAAGVAPIQVVVVPVALHKPGVCEKAAEITERLSKIVRTKMDDSDNSPGWKFAEYEMKGVPLRLEIGPRDIEQNQCVLVRRDTREKTVVPLDEIESAVPRLLEELRRALYDAALARRESMTVTVEDLETLIQTAKANQASSAPCGAATKRVRSR